MIDSRLRRLLAAALPVLVTACGGGGSGSNPPPPGVEANYIKLSSDAGDYIGGGNDYSYTLADARITVTADDARLTISVDGDESWTGEGRGCNTLTGWIIIDSVTYDGATLAAIDLQFEQHCEGGAPALHGEIHWTR
jgi:hypothetical protein